MPSGCSRLTPPKEPLGLLSTGSMRWLLNSFGDVPSAPVMAGASSASAMRTRIMIPAAIATLSRLRRIHAIWPSERPSMRPAAPARTASGAARCSPLETSMGAPTPHLPVRSPRRATLRSSGRRDTRAPAVTVDRFREYCLLQSSHDELRRGAPPLSVTQRTRSPLQRDR
jgi:hypothetical protein